MIRLQRKQVISTLVDNMLCNFCLASHGINRDQSSVDIQKLNSLRDSRNLIRLGGRFYLPQHQLIRTEKSINHVNRRELVAPLIRATQRFTINGNDLPLSGLMHILHPAHKT